MNRMNGLKTYAFLGLLALGLAGCSNTPVAPAAEQPRQVAPPPPAPAPAPTPAPTPAKPAAAPSSTVATVALPAHLDPKSGISAERSVYFDFDDYSIRSDNTALIERHGRYLADHPSLAIKVEGNADERGSPEYNLSLGQKRAESVQKALQIYGARASQMEAISWGESKPRALGHDEAAWQQNRRVDLQYPRS